MTNALCVQVKLALCLGDAIIAGFWGFMWFVCFCFTADKKSSSNVLNSAALNCVNSGIAFSFFSILVWVGVGVVWVAWLVECVVSGGVSRCLSVGQSTT